MLSVFSNATRQVDSFSMASGYPPESLVFIFYPLLTFVLDLRSVMACRLLFIFPLLLLLAPSLTRFLVVREEPGNFRRGFLGTHELEILTTGGEMLEKTGRV